MKKKTLDPPKQGPQEIIATLKKVAAVAEELLSQVMTFAVPLTDDQRKTARRPHDAFFTEAPDFLRASASHPPLLAATGVDPQEVQGVLDADTELRPLVQVVEKLASLLSDTHTAWVDNAYDKVLEIYGVAKSLATRDGSLKDVVKPGSEMFAVHPAKPTPKT